MIITDDQSSINYIEKAKSCRRESNRFSIKNVRNSIMKNNNNRLNPGSKTYQKKLIKVVKYIMYTNLRKSH